MVGIVCKQIGPEIKKIISIEPLAHIKQHLALACNLFLTSFMDWWWNKNRFTILANRLPLMSSLFLERDYNIIYDRILSSSFSGNSTFVKWIKVAIRNRKWKSSPSYDSQFVLMAPYWSKANITFIVFFTSCWTKTVETCEFVWI